VYPDVSLAEARDRREQARRQITNGVDPGILKQTSKRAANIAQENSFEAVAREWYAKHSLRWAPSHGDKIIRRLERDVFPWLGSRPISEITPPQLLQILRRIEDRGALETAHRAHQNCSQVFRYAVATGRAERDPTGDLRGALPPTRVEHYPQLEALKYCDKKWVIPYLYWLNPNSGFELHFEKGRGMVDEAVPIKCQLVEDKWTCRALKSKPAAKGYCGRAWFK
jgi:hypothetical protein